MKELITGGMTGLLMGIAIQRCALTDQEQLRGMLAFTRRGVARVLLTALGLTAILFALLGWLAVIDVDWLQVVPLHGGTLVGGAVFGAAMAWIGMSPGTALSGVGGGRLLESLCAVLGCLAGGLCLPYLEPLTAPVRGIIPTVEGTLFRVTLTQPFLFSGGFLGQGCVGLVLLAAALCLRPEQKMEAEEPSVPPAPPPVPDQPVSAKPEDVQDETFVAILPGEEPVVVDTTPDGEMPAEAEEGDNPPADGASSDPVPDSPATGDCPILPGEAPPLTEELRPASAEEAALESIAPAPLPPPVEEPPLEEEPGEGERPSVEPQGKPSKKKARKGKKNGAGGKNAMKTDRHPTEEPIMKDHPELDRPPQHEESLTADVVQVETGAGMVTPSQEAAMPVGARVINKTPPREGEITPGGEDPRKA